ncbi:DUF3164 family protein [Pseudoalteromonas sp. MM17-2]|uniref:DUF3164 family protein n=1 Tax=Pseudoalteromonas TaxID=53246 RepID=UPI001EF6CA05|nr:MULTISPECIES: DUF3164 family protein [Pseudoalteromonas]MCG7545576.1 DUF3164 family protein [Pseudoalteromonas sp. MM17-2]|tara:strand:- start:16245 stop:16874 length:630 start_codon:yes stop_codon:yes gene_type:complete
MNNEQNETRTYLVNARGFEVPLKDIKPSDLEKNDLVVGYIKDAKALSEMHAEFKAKVFSNVNDFIARMAESYNVEIGGNKGNITLTSFDQKQKVTVGVDDQITFGPEINVAKELLDKIVAEKSGAIADDKLLLAIINDAFSTNNDGQYSKARIMSLRKHRSLSDNEDWIMAMKALDDAIILSSTKTYVRFYERNHTGSWVQIPLVSKSL